MLRPVDYFMILGRSDKPEILQSWRIELKKWNFDHKIIAEFQSESPQEDFSVQFAPNGPDGILRGTVRGLERSHSINYSNDHFQQSMLPLANRFVELLQ